jgi:hypothetical protein
LLEFNTVLPSIGGYILFKFNVNLSGSQIPFKVEFLSDDYTPAASAAFTAKGFKLVYWQTTC